MPQISIDGRFRGGSRCSVGGNDLLAASNALAYTELMRTILAISSLAVSACCKLAMDAGAHLVGSMHGGWPGASAAQ